MRLIAIVSIVAVLGAGVYADPPSTYDLRDVGGTDYVTSVKSQSGGTCWTHGAASAIEGNLLMTGAWSAAGETGEPNLAEYHLDWWNGFNQHNNDDTDPPSGGGLVVHEGGDYRVTSAYLSRGEGMVRDVDGQSYSSPPERSDSSYHYYYVPEIEWFVAGTDLANINTIKEMVMTHGVLGTCMCYDASFISNYIHYQPPTSELEPNHAIAIVGWDDAKATQAPDPGAWLCKNSWGSTWGLDGYFWISYYDKHCCQNVEMGAISFQDVIPMPYDNFYYHDYHGWRDTWSDADEAFNAFVASDNEMLTAVSFFTAADSVDFTVYVYDDFISDELQNPLASQSGYLDYTGYHTIELDTPVELSAGDDFYIYVQFSAGGHPYDRTSDVPVLLGADYRTIVESSSEPGQSFYRSGSDWADLYEDDTTANFCIKGLCTAIPPALNISFPKALPEIVAPGEEKTIEVLIEDGTEAYLPGSATLHCRMDGGSFESIGMTALGGGLFQVALPAAQCSDQPEFYVSAEGESRTMVYNPPAAPLETYTVAVGTITSILEDSFESDLGWTTENLGASSGDWERGVPVDDDGWDYDPATDGDGSGQCYLTENVAGNTDVDGGAVRLTSPVFDMAAGGYVEYDYYLYLTDTDGAVDRLLVEMQNGDELWIEVALHTTDGNLYWRHHKITEDDLVAAGLTFTAAMQIRFTANDADPQSIVEAGVDGLAVSLFGCEDTWVCGDANGNGVAPDIEDLVYLVTYMFQEGPPPPVLEAVDVNNDGETANIADLIYLVDFMFNMGPDLNCP